ncbi:MAG: DUF72 domain-containing protein [Candidatus Dormiibacterota bacterium]
MTIYAGCSGFSYPEWRGSFYPARLAASKMLPAYADRLRAVELNGSFYRMPADQTLDGWAAGTPPAFRICCKGHRALTYSAAGWPREDLARELGPRFRRLGDRLGPLLLQFPPTRQVDLALLDGLLGALALPAAVECRHESWFVPGVYQVLREHGAALCVTDGERWPRAPLLDVAPFAYVRLRAEQYDTAAIDGWRCRLGELQAAHDDVFAFLRHGVDAPGHALRLAGSAGEGP